MSSLYRAELSDRSLPIGSFWETTVPPNKPEDFPPLTQDDTCDVAIIGGGITGLSAALHLMDAGVDVRILEAGVPAWGASGRNGGFCCVGATWLSGEELLRKFGREQVHRFFQQQRQGVELVRELAETYGIEIDAQGNGEIEVAHRPSRWRDLEAEYEFCEEVADYPCQLWSQKDLAEQGYASPEAHGALYVGVGFGLNPLKYSRGLATAVRAVGVKIHAHSPAIAWEKQEGWHLLRTPGGTLKARQVMIATNGYTEERLTPPLRGTLLPVISNIITTRPLTDEELDAQGWRTETPIYDTRRLLFYFRLLKDRRFLLGSRGGTVGDSRERDRYRTWMVRRLGEMFPAWKDVEITHYWNGLVCGSVALTPHIGQFNEDPSVFYISGLPRQWSSDRDVEWEGDRPSSARQPSARTALCRFPPSAETSAFAGAKGVVFAYDVRSVSVQGCSVLR
jgi:glycine/D-amino acid oxidase-like deaminating enzyme